MNYFLSIIFFCLAVPAYAATTRFDFFATAGENWFEAESGFDIGSFTESEIASLVHPLRDTVGKSGRVIIEVTQSEACYRLSEVSCIDYWTLECVSGFVCRDDGEFLLPSFRKEYVAISGKTNSIQNGFRPIFPDGVEWSLSVDEGRLGMFDDDISTSGPVTIRGEHYSWAFDAAEYHFDKIKISVVPAPSSFALMLSAILFPFAMRRRIARDAKKAESPLRHHDPCATLKGLWMGALSRSFRGSFMDRSYLG